MSMKIMNILSFENLLKKIIIILKLVKLIQTNGQLQRLDRAQTYKSQ